MQGNSDALSLAARYDVPQKLRHIVGDISKAELPSDIFTVLKRLLHPDPMKKRQKVAEKFAVVQVDLDRLEILVQQLKGIVAALSR